MKTIILSLILAMATVTENAHAIGPYDYVPYPGPDYLPGSIWSYMPLGGSAYPSGYFSMSQLFNILSGYSRLSLQASSGPYSSPCGFVYFGCNSTCVGRVCI